MKCKHVWIVIKWKYNYPGNSSLRAEHLTAEQFMCQKCEKVRDEQSK